MNLIPLSESHLLEAGRLFAGRLQSLRADVPALPDRLTDPAAAAQTLAPFLQSGNGLAAVDGGRLLGFLGWYEVDDMRSTGRKAAYVPVSAHSAAAQEAPAVYRALYEAAALRWEQQGCRTLAVSLLANDALMHSFWFWNNFGMGVVDAIRPTEPVPAVLGEGIRVRRAGVEDAEVLAALEYEHACHYLRSPVWMTAFSPNSADEFAAWLADEANGIWLACEGERAFGYLRFEGHTFGNSEIVESPQTIAITAAFVLPGSRGSGAAAGMLNAGLAHYRQRGFTRCSVDFESFNPHARAFWMRHFDPVCCSLLRHPERML